MRLSGANVADYARGCAVLGGGGGGDVRLAEALLRQALDRYGALDVLDPHEAARATPGASCALTGAVGSATVMTERLPGEDEFVAAVRLLERSAGPLDALVPLEIGGVNGLLGLLAAARLRLPVLDADAMGRTFPRLGQTVLADAVPPRPVALAGAGGGRVLVDTPDRSGAERAVLGVLPALGSWAAVALQRCDLETFATHGVRGSIARALGLGSALAAHRAGRPDAADLAAVGVHQAWAGTLAEVRRTRHGRGGVATLPHRDDPRRVLRLDFADEVFLALADGEVLAAAPDIVAPVDAREWRVVAVDDLRVGQHLRILVAEAPPEVVRHGARLGLGAYDAVDPRPLTGAAR